MIRAILVNHGEGVGMVFDTVAEAKDVKAELGMLDSHDPKDLEVVETGVSMEADDD